MKGNVRNIIGDPPKKLVRIEDMSVGDTGYAVPWAYDVETGSLRTRYAISKSKGGTVSMWVECVGEDEYVLEFETPIYRNPLTGEYSEEV